MPWVVNGFSEVVQDDGAGDAAVGGDREGVAGVVVEPDQDLDMGTGRRATSG